MAKKEFKELAQWVSDYALKNGASQAAITISYGRGVDIAYRDKKIEKLEDSTSQGLSLQVYVDNKFSSHSTNDLNKKSLEKFIKEAILSTKYLAVDKFRSLPDSKYYPKDLSTDLELYDKNFNNVTPTQKVNIAELLEEAARKVSNKIISATASYGDSYSEFVMVLSNGFIGEGGGTNYSISSEVTVNDNNVGRPEDYAYASTRFFSELPTPEVIGKEAADRALLKIGQKKIESGKYLMIIENRAAAQTLRLLTGPMNARALQQKSSWLDGMIDKKIASDKLTIYEDPFIKKGFNSKLFDGEGLAVKKRTLIENGILKTYLIDNYYGRKLGMEPNSSSLSNVFLNFGKRNLKEILKDTKKAIYVSSFIGGNSNSTTGDFSFGIIGRLIENGEFTIPLNEMNISGNAKEIWQNIAEIGNDPFPYSSWKVPTLVFEGVDFSGI